MRDLVTAWRGFRRTPTFVVAVLTILGLGIGMAVAIFTLVDRVLVRRLPVRDQDRVVVMWTYREPTTESSVLPADIAKLRPLVRTMHDVAGIGHYGAVRMPFLDDGHPVVLSSALVTGNYFDVLGARPVLGRFMKPEDDAPGAPSVMVLSYGLWRSKFGGSPSVLGRTLVEPYTRRPYMIIGVAPAGLDYPVGVGCWGTFPPYLLMQTVALVVARLAPGATLDGARAELTLAARQVEPTWELTGAHGETLTTAVLGQARSVLVALTVAVALLLVIACVNVGTLFLVRASSRARELAVRRALGATYGDLVRQLVVESLALAAAGGILGVMCAAVILRALIAFAPPQLPRLDAVQLDGTLILVAVGVTGLAVLLFGVLPALTTARGDGGGSMRFDRRAGAETFRRRRVRQGLVASQVSLALIMLAGAGLLARSLRRLEQLPLGYATDHLAIVSLAMDNAKYDSIPAFVHLGDQVEQRIEALPGVSAVSAMLMEPFHGVSVWHPRLEAEGQTAAELKNTPDSPTEIAGAAYFRAFQIPILQGRAFLESDRENAAPVLIVSQSVARRYWPGQDPVGKRLRLPPPEQLGPDSLQKNDPTYAWRTVVGVVPDTRFRELRATSPMVYFPWRQLLVWEGVLAVRSTVDADHLMPSIRRAVATVDPTLTVFSINSMDQLLGEPLAEPRLSALLVSAFGLVALILAAVGLYGVVASTVREETRSIGIRMALGATSTRIRGGVLRQALVVGGVGTAVGLVIALAVTRLLRSLLFEVSPSDPVTLAFVSGLLLAVTSLAAYLPAHRATRIDPVRALRTE